MHKAAKDREKRRSVVNVDKNEVHTHNNTEKGSPSKDGNIRKYAGIGPESVAIYSEQSTFEHLSEEVCSGLAEDLSYKLRYIIHDALIKARLSGRNYILSTDIDATFIDLNIEKIYGTSATPNWISLGDQNVYYLEDPVVNLIEVAEQECSFVQPGDVVVTKQWLPDTKDSKTLKTYFEIMCLAIVSNDMTAQKFALTDIKTNNLIGPIIKWFYHFGYFLLSKDITYDCLTLSALSLINSLERNPVAPLCVCEKQLKLLVRLILQRLLRSATTIEVLKPMCSILAILSRRLPIRELVMAKLNQKIPEVKENFTVPIMHILNAIGLDAIREIFVPYMDFLLLRVEADLNPEFTSAVLQTYSILCRHYEQANVVDEAFYNIFGDSLCSHWDYVDQKVPDKLETNWLNIKLKLLQSRQKVGYSNKPTTKYHIRDVFPDYNEVQQYMEIEDNLSDRKSGVNFKLSRSSKVRGFTSDFIDSLIKADNYSPDSCTPEINLLSEFMNSRQKHIIIGKRTLLISGFKDCKYKTSLSNRCYDHSLKYYNL
ncbi:TATA box binding protein associated factor (TAF) [Popillia japonica]|uniref:Transcription initiation factor TFIID subunit 6 n=1 Tax=Popillia japonica TaxID=7064 RepID=A0AAW1MKC1_POPJA